MQSPCVPITTCGMDSRGPCGVGNVALIVGMTFDEAPRKTVAPAAHVPIGSVANHAMKLRGLGVDT